jgi:CheY-like chemotaxis protein
VAKSSLSSPEQVEQCLDEIVRAAQRSAELTRQLLTLGRQQITKPQPVSIGGLLERLHAAFRRVLPSDVVLFVETPADDLTAHVDPAQLERALLNLVLNARDAMPSGGRLRIEALGENVANDHPRLAERGYVALLVADNGRGMDSETLERIFEPFFTTKEEGAGTGLGLATVYAFAKESGGDVEVYSTPGSGTTFKLLLPASTADALLAHASPAPELAPVSRRGRILVVEDRADVRANMVKILAHHGFDVAEAADGDRALEMLAERTNTAVLCIDGVMPGAGTASVIERARKLAPGIRVLVCSGYVPEELLRRGVIAGEYSFLPKPFSALELIASVRQLLRAENDEAATDSGTRT